MNRLLRIKGFDKYMLEEKTNNVISFYKDEINGKLITPCCDNTYRLWKNGAPEHLTLERIKYLANVQDKLSDDVYIVAIIQPNGDIRPSHSPKKHTKTSAIKEAERLATINPYDRFGIFRLEGVCKSQRIVWE